MRKRNCRETMTSVPRRKKRAPPLAGGRRAPPPPPSRVRSRTGGPLPEGGDGEGRAGARSFDPSALLRPLPRGGGRRIPHRPDANRRPPAPPFPIRRVPRGGGPRRRAAGGDSIRTARHVVSRRSRRFSSLFVAFRRFSSRRPRPLVARPRREWRSSRFGGLDGPRVTIAEAEA